MTESLETILLFASTTASAFAVALLRNHLWASADDSSERKGLFADES